jgi:hypothetical protein
VVIEGPIRVVALNVVKLPAYRKKFCNGRETEGENQVNRVPVIASSPLPSKIGTWCGEGHLKTRPQKVRARDFNTFAPGVLSTDATNG